jgi:molybdopterin synthase catalytic subunit/molybdopterin converting factor small subunit
MRVRVLFFGMLKDVTGTSGEEAEFPEGASLRSVFDAYAARHPALGGYSGSIVLARNQAFAAPATRLEDGDEVAFLPPVSGGCAGDAELAAGNCYVALVRHPVDSGAIAARLLSGAEGAVVTFEGTVRNHTNGRPTLCLDYEGYESMALQTMAEICREIMAAHAVERIAMVHRLGRMLVGETSVVVIATAPHRRAAFEAALEGINRLKKRVPIWKKEHFVDGSVWVEGEWDRDVPAAV